MVKDGFTLKYEVGNGRERKLEELREPCSLRNVGLHVFFLAREEWLILTQQ